MIKLSTNIVLTPLLMLMMLFSSNAQSSLADNLKTDTLLQENTIILIRSALGARSQTTAVRRVEFRLDIQFYIDTYRGLNNADTLTNIQNRYTAAKEELLEPRLPATVGELVSILETL